MIKQSSDREPFAVGPSTRVVFPDADRSVFVLGLGLTVGLLVLFAVASAECFYRGYPIQGAILALSAVITLARGFRSAVAFQRKVGAGFVVKYLHLERFVQGSTVVTIPWHEVRLVQVRKPSWPGVSQWQLDAYAPDGAFLGTFGSLSSIPHLRELTAFMMLRCGKLETDANYFPPRAESRRHGLVNFGMGVLLSTIAALHCFALWDLSSQGAFSGWIAGAVSIFAFPGSLLLILGVLDWVRGGRRGPEGREMTDVQKNVFRRVPLRVEMEPDLWYVYRDREAVYKKQKTDVWGAVWLFSACAVAIPLLLLALPPKGGEQRLLGDFVSAVSVFWGLALLTAALGLPAARRAMHRFKIEGDEFLVDTGRRILRFPIKPRFRWKGGHREEKWMTTCDRYFRFPYFYPVDSCCLVEEEDLSPQRFVSA
ncbi:MAG: hypothetical protein HONBIEJF_01166 [Fimbriimonadaceae bacterium]|nr:hypothetical protein [Fimbriimonadaceae bacterium]